MKILPHSDCLERVKYMGRIAQIIGKRFSSRYGSGVYYDLRMLDSKYIFRSVPANQCKPCEERLPDEPGIFYRGLELVKS